LEGIVVVVTKKMQETIRELARKYQMPVMQHLAPRDQHPERGHEGQTYFNRVKKELYQYRSGEWRKVRDGSL
jgi:hypothetical protein